MEYNNSLQTKVNSLTLELEEEKAKVIQYEEYFRLYQQKRFGSSSEKMDPNQQSLELFNEAEKVADLKQEESTIETITYSRKKKTNEPISLDYLDQLPQEEIYYYPEEEVCPECGTELHEMSTEVRKHIRHIVACRNCQKYEEYTPIFKAEMPNPAIPKSLVSSSLIAYIMDQKYTNRMPLYRQEKHFERLGPSNSFKLDNQRCRMAGAYL